MNHYSVSDFDDFLTEEGFLDEVSARAYKRLLALQLQDIMEAAQLTKTELAERMQTSRSQLDRLLDFVWHLEAQQDIAALMSLLRVRS